MQQSQISWSLGHFVFIYFFLITWKNFCLKDVGDLCVCVCVFCVRVCVCVISTYFVGLQHEDKDRKSFHKEKYGPTFRVKLAAEACWRLRPFTPPKKSSEKCPLEEWENILNAAAACVLFLILWFLIPKCINEWRKEEKEVIFFFFFISAAQLTNARWIWFGGGRSNPCWTFSHKKNRNHTHTHTTTL